MTKENSVLTGWDRSDFTLAGITHPVYRRGSGPLVVVVHEIPGITPLVEKFANEVVDSGFTVAMPLLVGTVGRKPSAGYVMSSMTKICISREFTTMALGQTSPVIAWLRGLAKSLHAEIGGKGVGAVGMCFSGGFALGMMVDDIMVAPVLSQPSLPFALGNNRKRDLNLSPEHKQRVVERAAEGCQVLGLRFDKDPAVGDRFSALRDLIGDSFISVELPSTKKSDHSVLTEHRDEASVAQVLEFFKSKLL